MLSYKHIDGSVFTTEADLIKHIRSHNVDEYNELSDEFVLEEAYQLGEFETLEINE